MVTKERFYRTFLLEGMIRMLENQWEEKLIDNVRRNTALVLEKNYGGSQTLMARELSLKINTLNTYINGNTKPSLTFVCKLCSRNNLPLEVFLYESIETHIEKMKKKELLKQLQNKYMGILFAYFFVIDSNSLKEGLIQEGELKINDSGNIVFEILNSNKTFTGNISFTDELIYFDLKNAKEKINITMKNPGKNIKEKYVGGIGIANISSPEDSRIPSAQKLILSSVRIPVDKYFRILSEFLSINTCIKIRKRLFIELLSDKIGISTEKYDRLKEFVGDYKISDEDKITIDDKSMKILMEVLNGEEFLQLNREIFKSMNNKDFISFNSIKINIEENKMIYRFIKNEFLKS